MKKTALSLSLIAAVVINTLIGGNAPVVAASAQFEAAEAAPVAERAADIPTILRLHSEADDAHGVAGVPDLAGDDGANLLPGWFSPSAAADVSGDTPGTIRPQTVSVSGLPVINTCDAVTFTVVTVNDALTSTNVTLLNTMPTGFTPAQRVCSYPEVAPNEVITCEAVFAGSCDAVSGQHRVLISQDGYADYSTYTEVRVDPGALTIRKSPEVTEAEIGDVVEWTITVENTSYGEVVNVDVIDTLGPGLAYASGDLTMAYASIPAGETRVFTVAAEVVACSGLDNEVTATWGCGSAPCQTVSAGAGIDLITREPLLDFTPPPVSLDYCTGATSFSMPVSNIGDGTAYTPSIAVDLAPLVVESSSAPYAGGVFLLPGPIPAGGSYLLTATLTLPGDPCGVQPGGQRWYDPLYYDACDNPFTIPLAQGPVGVSGAQPALNVSKTGPRQADSDEIITYTLDVESTNIVGSVAITDVFEAPCGYTLLDAGGGTVITGTEGTMITWETTDSIWARTIVFSPTLECPDVCGCCGEFIHNTLMASGGDCQDCEVSDSATASTPIDCEETLLYHEEIVSPASAPACTTRTFTGTYVFGSDLAVPPVWGGLILTDTMANMAYVPGSAEVHVLNGPVQCAATFDVSSADPLVITNISPTCAIALPGATVQFVYQGAVEDDFTCAGGEFYNWAYFDTGATGNYACAACDNGIVEEGVWVEVVEPAMTVAITGVPERTADCSTISPTLTINRVSEAAAYDVYLTFDTSDYASVEVLGTDGIAPTSFITSSAVWRWEYSDAFVDGTSASVRLRIQNPCEDISPMQATVHYDNLCTDDGAYDATCSDTASASTTWLDCNPIVYKFPEVLHPSGDIVTWTMTAINSAPGVAYNVTLTDALGSGLRYISSTMSSNMGSAPVAPITSSNLITWTPLDIQPGEKYTFRLSAEIIACDDLTNYLYAQRGCGGTVCQSGCSRASVVQLPETALVNTNILEPIQSCTTGTVTATVRSAGLVSVYDVVIHEVLPEGVAYVPGSTEYAITDDFVAPTTGWIAAADPTGAPLGPLVWSPAEIPELARLYPKQTVWVRFAVEILCGFDGGDVVISSEYDDVCTVHYETAPSYYFMAALNPDISVTKTQITPGPYDCDDEVTWLIEATNASATIAPVVWITDTLGAGLQFLDASAGYSVAGQVVTWRLDDLQGSATMTLTAIVSQGGGANCGPTSNAVEAAWGCVAPNDAIICLNTGDIAVDTDTAVRAVPDVTAVIAADAMSSCADSATVTVTVTNESTTAVAENVVVTLPMPDGVHVLDCSTGPCVPLSTWTETIGHLDVGESVVFTISIDLDCVAAATLEAQVAFENCCASAYESSVSAALPVLAPELAVVISEPPEDATCGDTITWTVTISNTGSYTAEVVRTGGHIGPALEFVTATLPHCDDTSDDPERYLYWETNNLAPGEAVTYTVVTIFLNPATIESNSCLLDKRCLEMATAWGCGVADGDPGTGITFFGAGGPCGGPDALIDCLNDLVLLESECLEIPDIRITSVEPVISPCDPTGSGTITVSVYNQSHGAGSGHVPIGTTLVATITVDRGLPEEQTYVISRTISGHPFWLGTHELLVLDVDYGEFSCGPHTYDVELGPICECEWDNNTASGAFTIDCGGLASITASGGCDQEMEATGLITGTGPFTYAWSYGDLSVLTGTAAAGPLITTHQYGTCGDFIVSLAVTDAVGCLLYDAVPVNINSSPVAGIGPGSGGGAGGGVAVGCAGEVTIGNTSQDCDEDNDPSAILGVNETLTFTWSIVDGGGATIWTGTQVNSEATPYPDGFAPPGTIAACGDYTATLVVTDSTGCTDTDSTPFYAHTAPAPPTLDLTADPCDLTFGYTLNGSDCDSSGDLTATLTITGATPSTVVVPVTGTGVISLSGQITVSACGNYDVLAVISDDTDCSASVLETVHVNEPPSINSASLTQPAPCAAAVAFDSAVADCDGDPLDVEWVFYENGAPTGSANTLSGTYTPTPGFCGAVTATLVVSDATCSDGPVTVQPLDLNLPPEITLAALGQTSPCATDPITFEVAATDCDMDQLTTLWTFYEDGVIAGTSSAPSGTFTPTAGLCGWITATVEVSDADCSDVLTVTPGVYQNQPPEIQAAALSQPEPCSAVISHTSSVDDCDGDDLVFAWTFFENGLPAGTSSEPSGTYAVTAGYCAGVTATLVVSDGICTIPDVFEVTVVALNAPPTLGAVTLADPSTCVLDDQVYSGYAEDCDADILTYTWTFSGASVITPSVTVTAASGALITGLLPVDDCGPVTVDFAASDGALCVTTDTLTYDVPCCRTEGSLAMTSEIVAPYSGTVEVGDVITFAVFISYSGEATATELSLTNTFDPAELAFVGSIPPGGVVGPAGRVTWADLTTVFGDLAAGDSVTLTVMMEALAETERTTNTLAASGLNDCACALPTEVSLLPVAATPPTYISLIYFRIAEASQDTVQLEWATAVEKDNQLFNIYRATTADFTTASLRGWVPAMGHGSTYRYTDSIEFEGPWFYWMADVDTSGRETLHGPVSTQQAGALGADSLIYLPVVLRAEE